MKIEDIKYKGKVYRVFNPGTILRSDNGKIIDQLLDGVTVIKTRKVSQYIMKNYKLTPEEYTILVLFRGDESLWPRCECGCGGKVKLRGIGRFSKCVNQSHANKVTSLEKSRNGTNPFSGKHGSELSHKVNVERCKNGTHHFQGKLGSERARKKNKELSSKGLHSWQRLSSKLKAARNRFKNSGSPEDVCEMYIASVENRPDIFKVGVSINSSGRKILSESKFSNIHYENIEVLLTLNRNNIADLEYEVKLKFNEYSILGTESFPVSMKSEIIEYIMKLYSSYQ